jgi:hypothetical protein
MWNRQRDATEAEEHLRQVRAQEGNLDATPLDPRR